MAQFGGLEQIERAHLETGNQPVGQLGSKPPCAFKHVMHLRLRNAQESGESPFGELSVLDANRNSPDQSLLQRLKRGSSLCGL